MCSFIILPRIYTQIWHGNILKSPASQLNENMHKTCNFSWVNPRPIWLSLPEASHDSHCRVAHFKILTLVQLFMVLDGRKRESYATNSTGSRRNRYCMSHSHQNATLLAFAMQRREVRKTFIHIVPIPQRHGAAVLPFMHTAVERDPGLI